MRRRVCGTDDRREQGAFAMNIRPFYRSGGNCDAAEGMRDGRQAGAEAFAMGIRLLRCCKGLAL